MSQCLAKPQEQAYKARSDLGWCMGSIQAGQRLVGLAIHGVKPPYERLGFVQARPEQGVQRPAANGLPIRASMRPGDTRPTACAVRDPLPPTPYGSVVGVSPKFSPVFQRNGQ